MRKNLYDRILKIKSKEQHLSIVPKSSPKKKIYYFLRESKHIKRNKKLKKKKSNHGQIDNLKFP